MAKTRVLFKVGFLYHKAGFDPLIDLFLADDRYDVLFAHDEERIRRFGFLNRPFRPALLDDLQAQGYRFTDERGGFDVVIAGDTLRNPGDYGEIIVTSGESRTIVRNRLHLAAARRGLTLRFLYARRRQLRFRVGLQPEVDAEQPAVTVITLPHQSGQLCSFVPAVLAADELHLTAQAYQHSEILGRESREALVRLNG